MLPEICCPYCIAAGFQFRKMARTGASSYSCLNCGHTLNLDASAPSCRCLRCLQTKYAGSSPIGDSSTPQSKFAQINMMLHCVKDVG